MVAGRNIKFLVIYTGQTEAGNISAASHVAECVRVLCVRVYMCMCKCVSDTQGLYAKGSLLDPGKVS